MRARSAAFSMASPGGRPALLPIGLDRQPWCATAMTCWMVDLQKPDNIKKAGTVAKHLPRLAREKSKDFPPDTPNRRSEDGPTRDIVNMICLLPQEGWVN